MIELSTRSYVILFDKITFPNSQSNEMLFESDCNCPEMMFWWPKNSAAKIFAGD